jgi:hypothetical protein
MSSTVTRLAVAACAAIAIACGGRDQAESDNPPATTTPGEAVGTSGELSPTITMTGCLTKAQSGEFVLLSNDEAMVRNETGTAGRRDDPDSAPSEPNRGAEDERLRHLQNPSAELGQFKLAGDADRLAMYVNREVEVQGHVKQTDAENSTPATLRVELIDATGPSCK